MCHRCSWWARRGAKVVACANRPGVTAAAPCQVAATSVPRAAETGATRGS